LRSGRERFSSREFLGEESVCGDLSFSFCCCLAILVLVGYGWGVLFPNEPFHPNDVSFLESEAAKVALLEIGN
jgi:hypothetical protein